MVYLRDMQVRTRGETFAGYSQTCAAQSQREERVQHIG